ncbi:MAG TPA: helix-turn-helix transcriptional regulator, partial [Myxococcales bacterium]|nr:helix-turn-helix transcriptional regulator [Myxococcales bacterium]
MGLGADIRKRRESFGFSRVDVASLASMGEVRILAIESGAELPTTSELGSLADALACNAADLARGTVDDPRRSVARFRGAEAAKTPSASDLRLLARAAEAGRILASLRKRLGTNPTVPLRDLRSPSAPSSVKEAWQDGYDLGVKARNQLSPAQKPIDSVQELVERFGVHVADV